MELLTVLTIQDPSAVSAEKTTLVMGYHVNQLVRIMSIYSEIMLSDNLLLSSFHCLRAWKSLVEMSSMGYFVLLKKT